MHGSIYFKWGVSTCISGEHKWMIPDQIRPNLQNKERHTRIFLHSRATYGVLHR